MAECPTCGKDNFSDESYMKRHHKMAHDESIAGETRDCFWCGGDVTRRPSYFKKVERAFCDTNCHSNWQSSEICGENHPSYNGGKISVDCDWCGKGLDRWPSQIEHGKRNFCDNNCLTNWQSEELSGEAHPNYKYGARDDRFTKKERRQIYERDDYTCKECGDDGGGNLNAHHIIPSSENIELAHDIENGVTLCIDCHADRHEEPVTSFILSQKS